MILQSTRIILVASALIAGTALGQPLFQVNQTHAGLDINGVQSDGFSPAVVNLPTYAALTLNITGDPTDIGLLGAVYVSGRSLMPAGSGGIVLGNGQIIDLDFSGPVYVGQLGSWGGNLSIPTITPLPGTQSLQRVQFTPSSAGGFALSQGVQLNTLPFCVLPPAPSGLQAPSVAQTTVDLAWIDHASDEIAYRVAMLPPCGDPNNQSHWQNVGGNLPPGTTNLHVGGLLAGATHRFKVRCENLCGFSAFSSDITVTLGGPNGPTSCLATRIGNTPAPDPIRVTWAHSGPAVTGFRVARRDSTDPTGNWNNVSQNLVGNGIRDWTDPATNLVNGRTYFYKVRAYTDPGCAPTIYSLYSNEDPANP